MNKEKFLRMSDTIEGMRKAPQLTTRSVSPRVRHGTVNACPTAPESEPMSPYLLTRTIDVKRSLIVCFSHSIALEVQSTGWERFFPHAPSISISSRNRQRSSAGSYSVFTWGSHPSNEKIEVSRHLYDQGLVTSWIRTNTSGKRNSLQSQRTPVILIATFGDPVRYS